MPPLSPSITTLLGTSPIVIADKFNDKC